VPRIARDGRVWSLAVDAVTAEVARAFDENGVQHLLLKGPAVARWLYEEGERHYTDTDLLVEPSSVEDARATLKSLGFRPAFMSFAHPGMEAPPAAAWERGPFSVDLHETIPGASAPPAAVWRSLSSGSTELQVGARMVTVPGEPARLAHVALHVAHHGRAVAQPVKDLAVALERTPVVEWRRAHAVAEALGAEPAFANGLSVLPEGRRVCSTLGIAPDPSVWLVSAVEGMPVAEGLERLRTARGARARAAILAGELFPSSEFMRWWSPLARRSRRGLLLAYLWRAGYLALRMPGGVAAWRRARRESLRFSE
jgi:hypothetical protein